MSGQKEQMDPVDRVHELEKMYADTAAKLIRAEMAIERFEATKHPITKDIHDQFVDVSLVKDMLIRMMTRNERDAAKAMLNRESLKKNFATMNMVPEAHLGYLLQILDKHQLVGESPTFEGGLLFGVTMTLAARSVNGRRMLAQMYRDICAEQNRHHQTKGNENEQRTNGESEEGVRTVGTGSADGGDSACEPRGRSHDHVDGPQPGFNDARRSDPVQHGENNHGHSDGGSIPIDRSFGSESPRGVCDTLGF